MSIKTDTRYKDLDRYIDETFNNSGTLELNERIEEYKTDVIDEPLTMAKLAQSGVPWPTFSKLSDKLGFSDLEWSAILDISTKSLQRYRLSKASFKPIQSDRILQLIRIMSLGLEAFDKIENFNIWLRRNSFPLGGESPISLLNVSYGQQSVYNELGRIIHGISV